VKCRLLRCWQQRLAPIASLNQHPLHTLPTKHPRRLQVKPFVVDDITYELELTKRSGDWMVKLVSPNEEVLRSRRMEARWGRGQALGACDRSASVQGCLGGSCS
jgi:hypothetical protein